MIGVNFVTRHCCARVKTDFRNSFPWWMCWSIVLLLLPECLHQTRRKSLIWNKVCTYGVSYSLCILSKKGPETWKKIDYFFSLGNGIRPGREFPEHFKQNNKPYNTIYLCSLLASNTIWTGKILKQASCTYIIGPVRKNVVSIYFFPYSDSRLIMWESW